MVGVHGKPMQKSGRIYPTPLWSRSMRGKFTLHWIAEGDTGDGAMEERSGEGRGGLDHRVEVCRAVHVCTWKEEKKSPNVDTGCRIYAFLGAAFFLGAACAMGANAGLEVSYMCRKEWGKENGKRQPPQKSNG